VEIANNASDLMQDERQLPPKDASQSRWPVANIPAKKGHSLDSDCADFQAAYKKLTENLQDLKPAAGDSHDCKCSSFNCIQTIQ
jgi:hypothetical protein